MEDWEAYLFQPKGSDELMKSAVVVFDTNVLLAAYQWRDITVKEMLFTLEKLANEGRLKIPVQVVKEFSINRPNKIIQLINEIETELSTLHTPRDLKKIVPVLEGTENYNIVFKARQKYKENLEIYKKGLISLRNELKNLFIRDVYLEKLKNIIEKSYLPLPSNSNENALIKDAQRRFENKIPPGFKDKNKEDNSAGDYIIWHSMLSLNEDVIFVTGDKKRDWVYVDKQNNPIITRKELVEEFYKETGGKSFACVTPKEFITFINPNVQEAITQDLTRSLEATMNLLEKEVLEQIQEILTLFDPLEKQPLSSHEYNEEAKLIYSKLYNCNSEQEVGDLVFTKFANMYGLEDFNPESASFIKTVYEINNLREAFGDPIEHYVSEHLANMEN